MDTTERFEHLLECLIQVVARAAIPEEKVRAVVQTGRKQLTAFNLCDGSRTLTEVARKARLDPGNLSRAANRWVHSGVAFWVGTGQNARLLHVFPITAKARAEARLQKSVGSRR